jgi:hypothetical protein
MASTMARIPTLCTCCRMFPMNQTPNGKGLVCVQCDCYPLILIPREDTEEA